MADLPELPSSSDEEFWGDAEKHQNFHRPIHICETHTKERFMEHTGYIANPDGTIRCKFCDWGSFLPGYYRVLNGKVIDLRSLGSNA